MLYFTFSAVTMRFIGFVHQFQTTWIKGMPSARHQQAIFHQGVIYNGG